MREDKSASQKTPLQRHLETLFEQMKPEEDAPEDMKKEVFDTIETLEMVNDIADLFTGKFGASKADFIDLISGTDSKEK